MHARIAHARSVLFGAVRFASEVARRRWRRPLVLRRAASRCGARMGKSRSAHCRLRRSCVRFCAHAPFWRVGVAFQGGALEPLVQFVGRAQSAPPGVRHSPRAAPASGSCLACLGSVRASCRSALVSRFVELEASRHAQVWRGKLALMVRKQALLHQPPNPSIERTSSSVLRTLPGAAHVQR